jgi:hypothetical protein
MVDNLTITLFGLKEMEENCCKKRAFQKDEHSAASNLHNGDIEEENIT